jgi:hypothetical protein
MLSNCRRVPHTMLVPHGSPLYSSASVPQTMLSAHTSAWAHDSSRPSTTDCGCGRPRIQALPSGIAVSMARASTSAPCALIAPVPCVSGSYTVPPSSPSGRAVYCSTAFNAFGVSPARPALTERLASSTSDETPVTTAAAMLVPLSDPNASATLRSGYVWKSAAPAGAFDTRFTPGATTSGLP